MDIARLGSQVFFELCVKVKRKKKSPLHYYAFHSLSDNGTNLSRKDTTAPPVFCLRTPRGHIHIQVK